MIRSLLDDYDEQRPYASRQLDSTRANRSMSDRLYIVGSSLVSTNEGFVYRIMGTTGNIYDVCQTRLDGFYKCTCPDFQRRHRPCKHIGFVVFKVFVIALNSLSSGHNKYGNKYINLSSNEELYQKAVEYHQNAETRQLAFPRATVATVAATATATTTPTLPLVTRKEFKLTDECPICYDPFNTEETTWCQQQCGQNFHLVCLLKFFQGQPDSRHRCPYCRHKFDL